MTSTHFKKQEQIIFLKAQRVKDFSPKTNTHFDKINKLEEERMVAMVFFSLTQKRKTIFTNKNRGFLESSSERRFFFQNKQTSKGKYLQIS